MQRVKAWELREVVREHRLAKRRQVACGVGRYVKEPALRMGQAGGVWWDGIVQCRSRSCPPCFLARRYRFAQAIEACVHEREQETRCYSTLATLTIRHHEGDPIAIVKAIRIAWRTLIQGRAFRQWKADHGIEWICAEEVTKGDNGWHPHLHVLIMPRTQIDTIDPFGLAGMWHTWWKQIVERKLGSAHVPSRAHGCDLSRCDSAAYLTKLGMELADPHAVKGSAPLALLAAGRVDEYMNLQSYRTRARDLTFSRGLSELRNALADLEPPASYADLLTIHGMDWHTLQACGWKRPLDVCEAAADPETALAALRKHLGPNFTPAEIAGVRTFTPNKP